MPLDPETDERNARTSLAEVTFLVDKPV